MLISTTEEQRLTIVAEQQLHATGFRKNNDRMRRDRSMRLGNRKRSDCKMQTQSHKIFLKFP